MKPLRLSSLDPVRMPEWRWAPFLSHAINALIPLKPEPYPGVGVSREILVKSKV